MHCIHGLESDHCPHCRAEMGIKPLTRLVTVAPREIPMPVPGKDPFLAPKTFPEVKLYESAIPIKHAPVRPERKFDLGREITESKQSLFGDRMGQFQAKYQTPTPQDSPDHAVTVVDLKKRFTSLD